MTELLREVAQRGAELSELDPAARRLALRPLLGSLLPEDEVAPAVVEVSEWIDGFGPLTRLMERSEVTDIFVNGPDEVWIEEAGVLQRTDLNFESSDHLGEWIERSLGSAGVRVDTRDPIGDARLSDGSRMHVVLPPLSGDRALISIRRFPRRVFGLDDLVERSFLTDSESCLLADAVRSRRTIAVGGGTGAGKTTLLNALLSRVPDGERVIVIEETPELRQTCAHWVSLFTRPANVEGRGAVDQSVLLRAALRMRPDRIVVGEVRGPEAAVALQAMSTGHEGSMLTVHSRSASEIADRLLDLALMSERAPGETALRRRIDAAIDLYVQVGRKESRRMVTGIVER